MTHCRNPPNTCLLLDPLRNGSPLGRSNVPVPQISHTLQQRTLIKQPHDGRRRERQWRVFRWRGARLLVANRSNGVFSGGGGGLFLIPYQDWGCISEYEAAESSHWVDRHSILQGEIIKTWIAIKSMRGQSISCRIGILKELAFSRSKYYAVRKCTVCTLISNNEKQKYLDSLLLELLGWPWHVWEDIEGEISWPPSLRQASRPHIGREKDKLVSSWQRSLPRRRSRSDHRRVLFFRWQLGAQRG